MLASLVALFIGLWSATALADSTSWTSWSTAYSLSFADANGDGRADAVGAHAVNNSVSDIQVGLSTGSKFNASTSWGSWSTAYTLGFADVNGDGRADAVGRNPSTAAIQVGLSTGSAFAAPTNWTSWSTAYSLSFADVNGDGRADIVGRNSAGDVQVGLSTGSKFNASTSWTFWSSAYSLSFADINGDGKADIVGRKNRWEDVQIGLSTGSGFGLSHRWTFWSTAYSLAFVDASGDGRADAAGRNLADVQVDTQLTGPSGPYIDSGSYRSSGSYVVSGGAYNYAPTVMLDGRYRMWWCSGIAGDQILYAESSSPDGPFHAHGSTAPYQSVLQPSPGSQFDGSHVCDPSVIRVKGTYYMYYGGLTFGGPKPTQIGVASSTDGISWTKLNGGNAIVTARIANPEDYGAGQPSAAYVDGYFYLMYTDTTGVNGNLEHSGFQYAIRSTDPTFQSNVEVATASGFVPRTAANTASYIVSESKSPDWQYSDALNAWIVLSNQAQGLTYVRLLSKDLSHQLQPDLTISANWSEGPGLVSTPEKHSLAPQPGDYCQRIPLDYINATVPSSPPNNLSHFGADLMTNLYCSELSNSQIAGMFNGYGIEAGGYPLTVVVDKKRLQFQLVAPARDITNNFIGTTAEVFNSIPYGATLSSGSPAIGATGRPAAFVLDNSTVWPVSSISIITDNNSGITYVEPSSYDQHPVGSSLYQVKFE
jgi:hypothetical protein